jgi:ABC-type antimicrobial peptide transport system permease subunit
VQRKREIGIRISVGARRPDIFRLVLSPTFRLIAAGLAFGLAGSFVVGRIISSLLFGVRPHEPSIFAAVAVLVIVTCLGAAFIPALRAVALDPLRALRQE